MELTIEAHKSLNVFSNVRCTPPHLISLLNTHIVDTSVLSVFKANVGNGGAGSTPPGRYATERIRGLHIKSIF